MASKPRWRGMDTGREATYVPWTGPQMGSVWTPTGKRRAAAARRPREAVVMTLLSRREVIFDARANTVESVPLPTFGGAAYGTWILSVAVAKKTSVLSTNQLKIWVQNTIVDEDNPSVVFVGDGPSVTISLSLIHISREPASTEAQHPKGRPIRSAPPFDRRLP